MSAVPLNRSKPHFRAPACSSAASPCEGCSCGKAALSNKVWSFKPIAADCATRSEPCSQECTCGRFEPEADLAFKEEPCATSAAPCAGCSCGKASVA